MVWMEGLAEIIQGYSADDILNMDKSGLFFKALSDTGLAKKLKSVKAVRNQKSDFLYHFLCPRVDSGYVNLLLLERVKFRDAFENCLILLNQYFHSKNETWMTFSQHG